MNFFSLNGGVYLGEPGVFGERWDSKADAPSPVPGTGFELLKLEMRTEAKDSVFLCNLVNFWAME